MHFGASTVQIALHTGCYFLPGNSKPVLFAGVSDSLQHVPPCRSMGFSKDSTGRHNGQTAFKWNFVLLQRLTKNAVSSKGNVYLLFIEIFEKEFSSATWNVHACGHGKAIGHGVGGSIEKSRRSTCSAWGRYHELQIICWWGEQGRDNSQALHQSNSTFLMILRPKRSKYASTSKH